MFRKYIRRLVIRTPHNQTVTKDKHEVGYNKINIQNSITTKINSKTNDSLIVSQNNTKLITKKVNLNWVEWQNLYITVY